MQISNQALVVLLLAAVALTGAAVWLTLRPPAPTVGDDAVAVAESIVELPPEVYRTGDSDFRPRGPVVVHAAEDTQVRLDCDGLRMDRRISRGQATFETVPEAGCTLALLEDGDLPQGVRRFEPVLPGDEVHCAREDRAILCEGSLAEKHAGTVLAWSNGPGTVSIDGREVGEVPIDGLRVPVGRHRVAFEGERARSAWTLTVKPDERIEIFFHAPAREEQDLPRRPRDAVLMPPTPPAP